MGAKDKRRKEPKVKDAEITSDGCLIVEFNDKVYPHTAKALFTPELLLKLVKDYGDIPPADFNDYPGVPVVDEEAVYEEDGEGDGEGEEEEGVEKGAEE